MKVNQPSRIKMRQTILEVVNRSQGIKAVDLSLKVMDTIGIMIFNHGEYRVTLDSLVKEKEVIELEYTLLNRDYTIKSIYFPAGTKFEFNSTVRVRPESEVREEREIKYGTKDDI